MTAIDLVIESRHRDIGGFAVRRILPVAQRRHVGPFVFVDHMGPEHLAPGHGMDVPPHPHIGLATITYLFAGEIVHRDSLGSVQAIRPGEVNWMIAGKGIVHSERPSPERRAAGGLVHGLQTWVALPVDREDMEPVFEHHAAIPRIARPGAELSIIAGTAYGERAPTGVLVPTLYVHAQLAAGAELPVDDEHPERALYVVEGAVELEGRTFTAGTMIVLHPGAAVIRAPQPASVVLVGGAPLDGDRHMYWNFVSSSRDKIEAAKSAWREKRMPLVPGDEHERVELPEAHSPPSR